MIKTKKDKRGHAGRNWSGSLQLNRDRALTNAVTEIERELAWGCMGLRRRNRDSLFLYYVYTSLKIV